MTTPIVPRALMQRFDVAAPRYTSYPTAPEWQDAFSAEETHRALVDNQAARAGAPLSLYVHVPFCRALCWYCACSMTVTRREDVVERYLDAVATEVERVTAILRATGGAKRRVVQIHWGGGTPTFLSSEQLVRLYQIFSDRFHIAPDAEISIEIHPPVTTHEQLGTLARLGFNRVSMGVQDFDPVVQEAVHRHQPYEQTAELIAEARRLGFASINVDLMYGLPRQTVPGFDRTLEQVATLRPDRLALFNYAHVPWLKPHQRLIRTIDLPSREDKLSLLEHGIAALTGAGYDYIGMDHFALPDSELSLAQRDGSLRRNFMGYTTCASSDVLAFGSSSISELGDAYLQNARTLPEYHRAIDGGGLAVQRGMRLSADDLLRRDVIQALSCAGRVDKRAVEARHHVDFDSTFTAELHRLRTLAEDGLVELHRDSIDVTPIGCLLLRNVCAVFDAYLDRPRGAERRFSRTI